MRETPKIIIIRGNSGSGKSTIAKALQHRFGHDTFLISQDVIRRDMLYTNDGADTKAVPFMIDLIHYAYTHCKLTILEGILVSSWYQELFETIQSLYGGNKIFAYYYELPFSETLKRHQTKPNRNSFGETEMRRWWKYKDYIGFIPERKLTKEISLEDTLELIYQDILNELE